MMNVPGGVEYVAIKDLKAGMKNINAVFIVLEVGAPTETKEGREVRTVRVADASAAVNVSVWDAAGALLQPGDIARLCRGYAAVWRAQLTLYAGKAGDLQKVGEFCMLFNEQLNMSEPQPTPPAALPPPTAPATRPAQPDRLYSTNARDRDHDRSASPGAGTPSDHKHSHKTYVRGRTHQRNNNRR